MLVFPNDVKNAKKPHFIVINFEIFLGFKNVTTDFQERDH